VAIKPIECLPGSQQDAFNDAKQQIVSDIMQIIQENIPLCEITIKNYSENYYRSAISHAIRSACARHNNMVADAADKVWVEDFEVIRRKDENGKRHWYIKFRRLVRRNEDGEH
jgi:hypothetical protein